MLDLQSALKATVLATTSAAGVGFALVSLQHSKTALKFTVHGT